MTIKHPCNGDNTWQNYGSLNVAPPPAPPGAGGGVFDGSGTWTLSNWDQSGTIFLGANWAKIAGGDVLQVVTATGRQQVTVVSNDGSSGAVPNDVMTLTITQDSSEGALVDGQPTGVWRAREAAVLCAPSAPGGATNLFRWLLITNYGSNPSGVNSVMLWAGEAVVRETVGVPPANGTLVEMWHVTAGGVEARIGGTWTITEGATYEFAGEAGLYLDGGGAEQYPEITNIDIEGADVAAVQDAIPVGDTVELRSVVA